MVRSPGEPTRSGDGLTSDIAAPVQGSGRPMTRQARSSAAMSTETSVHLHVHEPDTVADVPEARKPSDSWDLVHSAQRGDTSAFASLYDRYVDVVFRYVLFRVGDRELAEDVTSETFLRALRRITSVSYQGRDVGAWFVTIARNLVLDHVRSSRFRLEIATAEVDSQR